MLAGVPVFRFAVRFRFYALNSAQENKHSAYIIMETQTINKASSNSLRHSISVNDSTANILIKIRLDDECKNGHQDFSITATIWEIGKARTERNCIAGGCCHEDILEVRPDLRLFVDLHLADYTGVPMYAVENGIYHMKNQYFSEYRKITPEEFKAEFCEYYRITPAQYDELKTCKNVLRYAIKLQRLGVLEQWKKEADKAIAMLEEWTGQKFLIDSTKSNFKEWTVEEEQAEDEREKSGYYTPEKIAEREEEARKIDAAKKYKEIEEERDKEIEKAQLEYKVKKAVLDAGLSLKNFIFYDHSKIGAFNWKNFDGRTSPEEFEQFIASDFAKIDGVTWSDDWGKK